MSLIDTIKAADDSRLSDPIEVAEWGCTLHARTLTTKQQLAIESAKPVDAGLMVVCYGVCDADGNDVFSWPTHRGLLESKSSAVIQRLAQAVAEQNGHGDQAAKN